MMPEGRCTLPTEPGSTVLDHLAGLHQVISPEQIRQALFITRRVNPRACQLTHKVTLWIVLAMGLLTDLPIQQVFKAARRFGWANGLRVAPAVQARKRLGVAPIRSLYHQIVHPLATAETPGAFYQGWHLIGIDGTVWDVPNSTANARVFDRPTGGCGDGTSGCTSSAW